MNLQAWPWFDAKAIPRSPQGTALHRIVQEHLPEYLSRQAADGHPVPWFVAHEFDSLLKCGDPDHGQAILGCLPCGEGTVVPYSCKRRGICPDCLERRMMDRSQFIVERVIGQTPVRHWILSLPPPLRYILGYSPAHITLVLTAFTEALSHHQRWKAKRVLGLRKVAGAHTASMTVVHRHSANLALNVHFHSLVPDGVFTRDGETGRLVFRELPAPSPAEVAAVAWRTCLRTLALLAKRGEWRELADSTAGRDTVRGVLTIAGDARTVHFRADSSADEHDESVPRNGAYPFDLHAGQFVRAGDRDELLRLTRYTLSPPITHEQLTVDRDGRVVLRYKRPRRDGTEHVILDGVTFIARLAALIPRPKVNTVRFHGAWGPNSHVRAEAVPAETEGGDDTCAGGPTAEDRFAWSSMLRQAHATDIRRCPRCSGRLVLIALHNRWVTYRNRRRPPPGPH